MSRRRTPARRVLRWGVVVVVAVSVWPGCASLRRGRAPERTASQTRRISEEELWAALSEFLKLYEYNITAAARHMRDAAQSDAERRESLRLQLMLIPWMRSELRQPDALLAMLKAWVMTIRVENHVDKYAVPRPTERNGAISDALDEARVDIEDVAQLVLTDEEFDRTREVVHNFARESPITGTYYRAAPPKADDDAILAAFGSVLDIPLSPFRTMQGIDRGAAAIEKFNVVASQFADTVAGFPEVWQWRTQLVLLEMWESESAQTLVKSMEEAGNSARELTATAKQLPDELRALLNDTLAQLDAQQAALQTTLDKTDRVVAKIDAALARANETAATVDHTARSTAAAGEAWAQTAHAVRELTAYFVSLRKPATTPLPSDSASATSQPSGRSYDVRDYEMTADALADAARELQRVTADVRALLDDEKLAQQVALATTESRGLVDHIAWRIAQLLLLAFGLLVAYAVLRRLLRRAKAAKPGGE
jgi:hypothetical protein